MEKKNVVFLTVLAVATLLTAVVGTTFAYFTATVTGNPTTPSATITTANNLGITYSDGDQITGTYIAPGWVSVTKHIKVTNNGDNPVNYQIAWKNVSNSFKKGASLTTDDLVYSLVETTNSNAVLTSGATTGVLASGFTRLADKAYSLTSGKVTVGTGNTEIAVAAVPANGATNAVLVPSRTIAARGVQEFDLTIYYVENGVAQNENQSDYKEAYCEGATASTSNACSTAGGVWHEASGSQVSFTATLAASIVSTDGIHAGE